MLKKVILVLFVCFFAASCSRNHRRETILNYLHFIWRRQQGEIEIKKLEDIKSITCVDSINVLITGYAGKVNPLPPLDSVLNHLEKDIDYNSKLLAKTNQRIDSLEVFQKKAGTNEFVKAYIKSFTDLRDFTSQQIDSLKIYRNSFKKYKANKAEVLCFEILCQYKLRGHAPDTTSKVVTQTFFLSGDTRRIYLVK